MNNYYIENNVSNKHDNNILNYDVNIVEILLKSNISNPTSFPTSNNHSKSHSNSVGGILVGLIIFIVFAVILISISLFKCYLKYKRSQQDELEILPQVEASAIYPSGTVPTEVQVVDTCHDNEQIYPVEGAWITAISTSDISVYEKKGLHVVLRSFDVLDEENIPHHVILEDMEKNNRENNESE